MRRFCSRCGRPLTFDNSDFPDEIDVTTASLDDPEAVPPTDQHAHDEQTRLGRLGDGLREYPESRENDRANEV